METFARCSSDGRNANEKQLFRYIKLQNVDAVKRLLKDHGNQINIENRDNNGFTCLEAAVLSQNEKLVELILSATDERHSFDEEHILDDALILASRLQNEEIVGILLKKILENKQPKANTSAIQTDCSVHWKIDRESSDVESDHGFTDSMPSLTRQRNYSTDYKLYITDPIPSQSIINRDASTLSSEHKGLCEACVAGNRPNIETYIKKNIVLPTIEESVRLSSDDLLQDFSERLEVWKAVTSPDYISITEKDPVISAFKNNSELRSLSRRYPEYQNDLRALATQSEQFPVDLLGLCKTEKQVRCILSRDHNANVPFAHVKYGRLLEALKHKQKKFVAHPHCQTFVNTLWTEHLQWRQWIILNKFRHVMLHAVLMPIITIVTAIGGPTIIPAAKVPLNRFIYSATSYIYFLILLVLYLMCNSSTNQILLYCITVYAVTALLRILVTDVPMYGTAVFLRTFWSMYGLIMYSMFLVSFLCIIYWHNDPVPELLEFGESTLSVATILSFLRLFSWFHFNIKLGPFIIAFKKIIFIVYSLLWVFVILFLAFAFSLHFLYKDKAESPPDESHESAFSMLSSTFGALFWTMYGYAESDYTDFHFNATEAEASSTSIRQFTGLVLWGTFHIACIIVLVNMLIAMMTATFERIHENCDIEWKFACTKMKLYYFEDCTAIPEPFNILYLTRAFPVWIYKSLWKRMISKFSSLTCRPTVSNNNEQIDSVHVSTVIHLQACLKPSDDTQEQKYMNLINGLINEYRKNNALKQDINYSNLMNSTELTNFVLRH